MSEKLKKPLIVIAIAGASASGKSKMVYSLREILNLENTTHFDLDGYHLHNRNERIRLKEYPDQPQANDFKKIINHLMKLKSGQKVFMQTYDHKKGDFTSPVKIIPKAILFVEGLHAILLNDISKKQLTDISIFLYPEEDLRTSWKIFRDTKERNYDMDDATRQVHERHKFVQKYVLPQKDQADILILKFKSKNSDEKIRHEVLISDRYLAKLKEVESSREFIEKYFNLVPVIDFKNFSNELHFKRFFYEIEEKISILGLKKVNFNNIYLSINYSYNEIIEIVSALILIELIKKLG
ncbi:MAG: uridine kinase family protein [Candidatus Heimdallarchaeota archaeon]